MKDLKRKTDYFLNSCTPIIEDEVMESIQKKTLKKIEESKYLSSLNSTTNPKKKKSLWITVFSATAAAAILILSLLSIKYISSDQSFMDIVAISEQEIHENSSNEILLILSDSRQIKITQDDLISFDSKGRLLNPTISSTKENNLKQKSLNQLLVPKGMRSQLQLSDGTKVWVNAGSKIIFPEVFSKEKRDIYIDGEAYMEVASNPDQPFYVTTNGFEIKVLGTSFNVFAYKDDIMKEIALVSGKIEVTDKQNQVLEMKPNELVTFSQNSISEKKHVNAKDYKSWVNRLLILNGETLKSIAYRLSLTYGVEIDCDSSIGEEEVYGKLDLKNNIEEILNYLELMLPLSVEKKDGSFNLRKKQINV